MKLTLCDVAPRDGLQNEPVVLDPTVRAELCTRLAAAGAASIEAVSFVREDRVPTMARAEEVIAAAGSLPLSGLVLNERGYRRARAAGLREVHYAFPVTESFARRNQGTTVEAGVRTAGRLGELAHADGIRYTVTLAVAFGCPFEGPVPERTVVALAERVAAARPDAIVLADSIGVAVPRQVRMLVGELQALTDVVGGHFHNTRNTGYANALAAVEAGARWIDAATGGLGGCPFAPGATGNIAMEDLVYLLDGMGVDTGMELEALRDTSAWLARQVEHELPSLVAQAGGFPLMSGKYEAMH